MPEDIFVSIIVMLMMLPVAVVSAIVAAAAGCTLWKLLRSLFE